MRVSRVVKPRNLRAIDWRVSIEMEYNLSEREIHSEVRKNHG